MMTTIIVAFIFVSLAFAFLPIVANNVDLVTEPQPYTEVVKGYLTPLSSTVTKSDSLAALVSVKNSTGITMPATNYTFSLTTGAFVIKAPQANNTDFTISYTYYDDSYISDSGSNNVTALITLMVAIGILGGIIALIYPKMRDELNF